MDLTLKSCCLTEFDTITRTGIDKLVKPILVFTVDGGPDENPRYQKVIKVAIHHFLKPDLDSVFVATNAPGRSAFNRVERKIAPLSRELSGLILPHDNYGSHLDERGKTIDIELEKKNFEFARKTLAEIWSQLTVDDYPTIAEYMDPLNSELMEQDILCRDQNWCDTHVRSSQYLLQIVKCNDNMCCSKARGSYFSVIKDRFFPPPLPLVQSCEGHKIPERAADGALHKFPSLFATQSLKTEDILPRSENTFRTIPYDLYCPSLQSVLNERICKICHVYFSSLVMLRSHSLLHKQIPVPSKRIRPMRVTARRKREMMVMLANAENGESVDWIDEEELGLEGISLPINDVNLEANGFLVRSMEAHLTLPWDNKNYEEK